MTLTARRKFLAQTAALAAAPLIARVSNGQAPARKLGVALCGLGSLAPTRSRPRCRRRAIAAWRASSPARRRRRRSGRSSTASRTRTSTTTRRWTAWPTTRTSTSSTSSRRTRCTCEHTLAAAAAGKHVFCEKPMEISRRALPADDRRREEGREDVRHRLSLPVRAQPPRVRAPRARRRCSATSRSSTPISVSRSVIRRSGA